MPPPACSAGTATVSRCVTIAALQRPPVEPGPDRWSRVAADVRRVCAQFPATRLVVLPEYHAHLLAPPAIAYREHMEAVAEPIPGPGSQGMAQLARDLGIWLVPGSFYERGPRGAIFNTTIAIDPDGSIAAVYRKLFPWRPFESTDPGTEFTVFDVPSVGRVGLSICYDGWFPEVARHLAWLGAEVIIQPTCTTTADREQEIILARATAIVNQLFVVSVNTASPPGCGRSLIVDPEGGVRVQAGEGSLVLTDVLDLGSVPRIRSHGTLGIDRVWQHFRAGDPCLELPLYEGRLRPERWTPRAFGTDAARAAPDGPPEAR